MPEFIAGTCLPSCMANHGNSSQVETFSPFSFSRSLFFSPPSDCGSSPGAHRGAGVTSPHPHLPPPPVTEMFRRSSACFFVVGVCMSSHLSAVVGTQLMMSFLRFHFFLSFSHSSANSSLSSPFLLSCLELSGCLSGVPPPSGSWERSQGPLAWLCVHDA